VEGAVKNAKSGQVTFRADKAGIIHCSIGLVDFDVNTLKENLVALVADLNKAKPTSAKGIYMKKLTLSSTMGPSVIVDQSTVAG
jgi:large subunit ribosomal protein L1